MAMKMHDIIIGNERFMCVDDDRAIRLTCKLIEDYSRELHYEAPDINLATESHEIRTTT